VFDIEPSGTQFRVPATVAFAYANIDLGGLPPGDFAVSTVAGGAWQAIAGQVVSASAQQISGTTMHLSPYALVAQSVDAGSRDGGVGSVDGGGQAGEGGVASEGGTTTASCDAGGLACQVSACAGGGSTTITGTVYDPVGANPLYNVQVYVPGASLPTFAQGASCQACSALFPAQVVASAVTDESGGFTMMNAPSGANIPLVIQIGKWRRTYMLPSVTACLQRRGHAARYEPAAAEQFERR
jgi:hypothetical protein